MVNQYVAQGLQVLFVLGLSPLLKGLMDTAAIVLALLGAVSAAWGLPLRG